MLITIKHIPRIFNFALTFLCVQIISFYTVSAQNIYKTEDGHLEMMTMVGDKLLKAETHKLSLYLDYSNKVVNGILDLKTLSTNNPEINTILTQEEDPLILRFSGDVPSTDFLSKVHDPINFNWLVSITYKDNTYKALFKATITHVYLSSSMSCVISASGQVLVKDTGLESVIPGLGKTIDVQFAQTVLKLK
tara:strand:- start:12371 stop:12946 length:576 start_codon:yes stop_codon:yes gene_type:complete